ncbi:universal stress protein [Desulfofundulus thermobenzoicus]|uniref:Universal stress protein n=1 Tax=Desulfofundulus thermobenzoicus TaxID=29376 RepID=A0A6N7INK9_9FIRM|nr:universal stress protein [Desulfofundulus thermobenzoicus]MQL51605.1 universal stress protein [Desulfofundulus thermobenzoicus]HHW42959.1 universal stress protein [Desulfotomaculum sp.]
MYRKILVAYDGSPHANKALTAGIELARCCGGQLHAAAAVHLPDYAGTVSEVDDMASGAKAFYSEKLEKAAARAAGKNVHLTTHIIYGHTGEAIVRFAREENFDLIIVGSHGWSAVQRLVMGSVSTYVVRHAHCPVLVEKGTENNGK